MLVALEKQIQSFFEKLKVDVFKSQPAERCDALSKIVNRGTATKTDHGIQYYSLRHSTYRLLRNPNAETRRGTFSERFEIPDENSVVRFKVSQYNGLRLCS